MPPACMPSAFMPPACVPPACMPSARVPPAGMPAAREASAAQRLQMTLYVHALFSFADMPARTKCVAYVLRALMIMMVISSDEIAAVHSEQASFNVTRKLRRTTSDLAYESQERKSRRIQAPPFRANPGKTMPCRALRTVPRNAQRPRPQIFTACRH